MNIQVINPADNKVLFDEGSRYTDRNGNDFSLVNGAYRFIKGENYTSNFGFQWNKFQKTQIDQYNYSSAQSRERFFAVTNWDKENLDDKNILEVGSGAGRFTNIVLKHTKANVYSVDYSNAVEANARNNGPQTRLKIFQSSIYELPFSPNQFDKVFCFGVLQHTPDFKKSVKCLVDMVKPGGELVVDFYPIRGWYTKIHSKYLLRPFTRRMTNEKLLTLIEKYIDTMISLYQFFDKIGIGKIVNRFLPICDIKNTIPQELKGETLREWVILDTFDMFSPAYDQPRKLNTVVNWFKEFGMNGVQGTVIKYGKGNKVTVVKGMK